MSTKRPTKRQVDEYLSNIGTVCGKHAPKPQTEFAKEAPAFFIGKWVKKAFKVNEEDKRLPQVEHIWVKVLSTKDGILHGTLANQPLFMKSIFGDETTVTLNEIEAVSESAD